MRRTQIYLTEEEARAIAEAARASARTRSQLIRDAIDAMFLDPGRRDFTDALRRSFGVWKRRGLEGETFVEQLRRGRRWGRTHGARR